jgi:hypothetical protein
MKKIEIKKGKHRDFVQFKPVFTNRLMIVEVIFTEASKYRLPGVDQHDWNKLAGVYWLPGIHKTSARIVWRYVPNKNGFQLALYCYHDGIRAITEFPEIIAPGELVRLHMMFYCIRGSKYVCLRLYREAVSSLTGLRSFQTQVQQRLSWRNIGFCTSPYFGGNNPAPQDIVYYQKIEWR